MHIIRSYLHQQQQKRKYAHNSSIHPHPHENYNNFHHLLVNNGTHHHQQQLQHQKHHQLQQQQHYMSFQKRKLHRLALRFDEKKQEDENLPGVYFKSLPSIFLMLPLFHCSKFPSHLRTSFNSILILHTFHFLRDSSPMQFRFLRCRSLLAPSSSRRGCHFMGMLASGKHRRKIPL